MQTQSNQWRSLIQAEPTLSTALFGWLSNPRSLTQHLNQQFPTVHYQLVQSHLGPIDSEEKSLSSFQPTSDNAWTRQVLFSLDNHPLVFSKAVIPVNTSQPLGSSLNHFGARPLGELLFAENTDKRQHIEIAVIDHACPYFALAERYIVESLDRLVVRRSVCFYQTLPILIIDMFLPTLITFINERS